MTANTLTRRTTSTDAATWVLRRADGIGWDFALTGDKATIGSGQSCTVRLIDRGVRPLHCLVTKGQHGLTVRRWSDDTLLNGEVFTEATLVPGDRLTIGPVDLLLEYNGPEPAEEQLYSAPISKSAEPEATVAEVANQVQELLAAPKVASVPAEKRSDTNRQRAKQLVNMVRHERSERERLAMEIASLESRLASTETERERLVFERDELAGRLASLTSEISQVRDEVRALSASHHQREQSLENRLSELEQQIADRDSLVIELRDELTRQRQEATEQFRGEVQPAEATRELSPTEPAPIADRATELDGEAEVIAKAEKFVESATIDWWKDAPRIELPTRPSEESDSTFQLLPQGDGPIDDYLPVEVGSRELDHHPIADPPLAESESEPETELDSLQPESLWDIEVQSPAIRESEPVNAAETFAPELEVTSIVESELDTPASFDRGQSPDAEPVRSEQDLWGRLSSLRAEASERLHYEVEHPEAVTEASHDFWAAPPVESEGGEEAPSEPHREGASLWLPEAPVEAEAETATDEAVTEVEILAPVKREEPVSFIEKYKHLLDEDDSTPAPSVPVHREPEPVAMPAPKAEHHDDESIEAYMEKMMARLRGEPAGPTLMGDKKQLEAQAAKQQQQVVAEAQPVVLTPVVPVKPLENLHEIKSGPTPEHATDMSMLRDLANNSAREAIKIAHSRRQRERAGSNLLMCLIGCVSGGFLVWASKGQMGMPLYAGAGAIAAAGYWAIRCGRALLAPGQPKADRRQVEVTTEAALPIR
ncbi:FHA domain-containing protein [Aeoliella sp. SH292]|uniref:FHA domain-containing protein n=1 Tax=Aeoliella sp. SH292 TaxID=3454464 RepID=UPI003F984616